MTLLSGHDLRAADKGGKSDPFAIFTLNEERVYKSQVKKKTLDPEWDEVFVLSVVSIRMVGIAVYNNYGASSHHASARISVWRYSIGIN